MSASDRRRRREADARGGTTPRDEKKVAGNTTFSSKANATLKTPPAAVAKSATQG